MWVSVCTLPCAPECVHVHSKLGATLAKPLRCIDTVGHTGDMTTKRAGSNQVKCVCGRDFKNKTGLRHHSQVCEMELGRSAMFIKACETDDWSAYNAKWRGGAK